MPERNIDIKLAAEFNEFCEQFSLPLDALMVTKERLVTPKKPLIWFADSYLGSPPLDLLSDKKAETVDGKWTTFVSGIKHLINPFTKFNPAAPDIKSVAADTYLAGSMISSMLPGSRFVLPKAVGFDPVATYNKSFNINDFNFEFNMWEPGEVRINYLDTGSGAVGKFDFGLTLNTEFNSRRFQISQIFQKE